MEDQRRQLLAQWEVKLNRAQEATEAANAAHTADKEAVELAASRAVAAAAGEVHLPVTPLAHPTPACPHFRHLLRPRLVHRGRIMRPPRAATSWP